MDRNRFFEELICWNQNYIRMINEHLNWIRYLSMVDYNLQKPTENFHIYRWLVVYRVF